MIFNRYRQGVAGRPWKPVRALVAAVSTAVVVLVVASVAPAAPASADDVKYSIGGGLTLPDDTTITAVPGQTATGFAVFTVKNSGTRTAVVRFLAQGLPAGSQLTASEELITLQPNQVGNLELSLAVGGQTAPGNYHVQLAFEQQNIPTPTGTGIVYVPAVSADFTLAVAGEAGSVVINAVVEGSQVPVSGDLTVLAPAPSGPGVPMAKTTGTSLAARLAPGQYTARFEIEGLTGVDVPFNVTAGQQTTVTIPVEAVGFLVTEAVGVPAGGEPTLVNLKAVVDNAIDPIKGPVVVRVQVSRDDQPIDTVTMQTYPTLPTGNSEVNPQSYVPGGGWQPGTYSFAFQVVAPGFTVTAPNPPTLQISWWTTPKKLAGGLVLVVLVGFAWWLWRRRNRTRVQASASLDELIDSR